MKTFAIAFVLALPLAAFAQPVQKPESGSPGAGAAPGTPAASPQYGQGGSPHCDKMSGEERAQCLKDEGAKTDSKSASETAADKDAASGATTPATPQSEPAGKKSSY